jgi:hypothetical protein
MTAARRRAPDRMNFAEVLDGRYGLFSSVEILGWENR